VKVEKIRQGKLPENSSLKDSSSEHFSFKNLRQITIQTKNATTKKFPPTWKNQHKRRILRRRTFLAMNSPAKYFSTKNPLKRRVILRYECSGEGGPREKYSCEEFSASKNSPVTKIGLIWVNLRENNISKPDFQD
jgi:hypothetical protein